MFLKSFVRGQWVMEPTWSNNWTPGSIYLSPYFVPGCEKVISLLNSNSNSWDVELIFPAHIAANIVDSPLQDSLVSDKLFWPFDKHRVYAIKSSCV